MVSRLDKCILDDLFERKREIPLDREILKRLQSSPMSEGDLRFLGMIVRWKRPQHILELGCGVTTLLFKRLQHRVGSCVVPHVTSVDHSPRRLAETRRALGDNADVTLLHAPLAVTEHAGRVFTTYHPAYLRRIQEGTRFDLVMLGGPPPCRYGREAPLYHLAPFLMPAAWAILPDASSPMQKEALRNWQARWPKGLSIEYFPDLWNGLAVMSIGTMGLNTLHQPEVTACITG